MVCGPLPQENHPMKPAHTLAIALLALVAIGHIVRLLLHMELVISRVTIPMWPSVAAVVVFLGVAVALWRETTGKEA